jgi:hypothetical protein
MLGANAGCTVEFVMNGSTTDDGTGQAGFVLRLWEAFAHFAGHGIRDRSTGTEMGGSDHDGNAHSSIDIFTDFGVVAGFLPSAKFWPLCRGVHQLIPRTEKSVLAFMSC